MADQSDTSENQLNPRHRLVYIRQRLIELREERERLMSERNFLRAQAEGEASKKRTPQNTGS